MARVRLTVLADSSHNPCSQCDARCCRSYTVYVTHKDVYRIWDATGIDPYEFTAAVFDKDFSEVTDNGFPTFFIEGKAHGLVLEEKPNSEDCYFLDTNFSSPMCSIHGVKPVLCRIYPHGLTDDIELSEEADDIMCDADWFIEKRVFEDLKAKVSQLPEEINEFAELCQEWNGNGSKNRSFGEFIEFLKEKHSSKQASDS